MVKRYPGAFFAERSHHSGCRRENSLMLFHLFHEKSSVYQMFVYFYWTMNCQHVLHKAKYLHRCGLIAVLLGEWGGGCFFSLNCMFELQQLERCGNSSVESE